MSLQQYYHNVAGITGGYSGDLGGVRNYSGSPKSGANEQLVRGIARELKDKLGLKGVNPSASSLEDVCKSIMSNLPLQRNKKGVKADSDKHKGLVRQLANSLNGVYGAKVLDSNADPDELADKILELLDSLCSGLKGEYAAVSSEVKRVIKNLKELRLLLDKSHQNLMNKVEASDDAGLKSQSVLIDKVHELLVEEVNRQHAILQNLMKTVVDVSDKNLASILEENKDIHKGIVKRLQGGPGSKEYSHKLMTALAGAGNVSLMAYEVDKALKAIGISLAEYEKSKNIRDLEAKVGELMSKKLDKSNPDLVEIGSMMRALEIVRNFDYHKEDIVKSLKRGKSGGDDEESYEGGSTEKISKRIQKRRKLRDAIFRVHNAEMARVFDSMVLSIKNLGRQLGTEIISTEPLDKAVQALTNLPDMSQKHIYLSLTGYLDHATARHRRQYFVNQLQYTIYCLDKVMKMDVYSKHASVFQSLKNDLQKLLDIVNRFKDYFKTSWKIAAPLQKSGAGEECGDCEEGGDGENLGSSKEPNAEEGAALYGSPSDAELKEEKDGAYEGGSYESYSMPIPEITKSSYEFKNALDDLRYYYGISRARYSLAKVAVESRESAEDYMTLLGDGVGKKLEQLTKAYNDAKEELNKGDAGSGCQFSKPTPVDCPYSKEERAHVQSFRDDVYKAQCDLYRTAEAIEVYLQAFSDAITSHPDEVKSLKQMLDSVDLAAKWFTNKSGDNICEVFDCFPSHYSDTAAENPMVPSGLKLESNETHYYEAVARLLVSAKLPGNPLLPITPEAAEKAVEGAKAKADKAVRSLSILKNLVSAFFSIGQKFGDAEIRKKTHMTTVQVFQNLNNYLRVSAFVSGIQTETGKYMHREGYLGGTLSHMNSGTDLICGVNKYDTSTDKCKEQHMKETGVVMNSILQYDSRGTAGSLINTTFCETDQLFVQLCKCLVAKPLTVVGVYNMFNRPSYKQKVINPIRAVLGGADEYPKVESKLMALYVRLPLLAEFYRNIFDFDKFEQGKGENTYRSNETAITMVPEVEGLFGGLIDIVFDKASYVKQGFYSDTVIKQIVDEINRIYSKSETRKDSMVTDIVNEFVAEMNRRYGLVARSEAQQFTRARADYERKLQTDQLDLDYPILPGEDEPQVRMPAPSDAYHGISVRSYKTDAEVDPMQKCIVNKLRSRIDTMFYNAESETSADNFSFNQAIYQAQQDLAKTDSDKDRFRVVADAIQGSGKFLRHGGVKTLMFNETVVSTLNLLGSAHSILRAYRQRVLEMDLEDLVNEYSSYLQGRGPFTRGDFENHLTKDKNKKYLLRYVNWPTTEPYPANTNALLKMVDHALIMDNLIELLFGQACDLNKLVEVKVVDNDLMIDHSGLKNVLEKAFEGVREMINKLRGEVPSSLIEDYERKTRIGSLYWLEENLMDNIIRGRRGELSLDECNQKVSDTLKMLIEHKEDQTGAPVIKHGYKDSLKRAVQYDELDHAAASPVTGALPANSPLYQLLTAPGAAGVPAGIRGGVDSPAHVEAGNTVCGTINNSTANISGVNVNQKSLWGLFNEVVNRYLNTVYDASTQRAYAKAVAPFAAGPMSQSVNSPLDNAFPDVAPTRVADPETATEILKPNMVLTASNAHALNALLNRVLTNTGKPAHLVQELADVPDHVKERFRANMPGYVKELDTIIRKAELLKNLEDVRGANTYGAGSAGDLPLDEDQAVSRNVKRDLNVFIDALMQACFSLRTTAANVLKELDDQPKYLEVAENSIESYRAMYGNMPVMPLSSLNSLLINVVGYAPEARDAWNANVLLPYSPPGGTGFKLRYGARYVLGRPGSNVSLDHVPWMKELLESSNGLSDARSQIEASKFTSYLQNHIDLLRYLVDARQIRGKLTRWDHQSVARLGLDIVLPDGNPVLTDTTGDNDALGHGVWHTRGDATDPNNWKCVFSMQSEGAAGQNLDAVVAISETSAQDRARAKLIKAITGGLGFENRNNILVRNLTDMNIMPINVRALMREVVFVNIYNYSYTWDHMVADMFGYHPSVSLVNDCEPVAADLLNNPRDTFVRMLIYPYQHLDYAAYYGLYSQIMAGNTGVQLGRPKFLGDQLYNKALLGELYPPTVENAFKLQQNGQAGRFMNVPQNPSPRDAEMRHHGQNAGARSLKEVLGNKYPFRPELNVLTYLVDKTDNKKSAAAIRLKEVSTEVRGNNLKQALRVYGMIRFNTVFARNLLFLGNLQRVMRLKLSQELSWNKRVSDGTALLDPRFTELDGDKSSYDKNEGRLANSYEY